MQLSQLIPDIALPGDVVISGLVLDSRQVRPGDAFVCVAGFGAHGLHFVEQARASGAAVILYDHPAPEDVSVPSDAIAVPGLRARMGDMADAFHGQPSRAMTMVGVTGTNGKTSTVQLLGQAWQLLGITSGSIGTLGVGLYGQVVPTGFTTPLVLQMHQVLGELRDAGARATAMEVSSHALDQGRVDAVHYDIAVFTNLTRDHLDYHGTMAAYGAAKARLFQRTGLKAAVVNLDDPYATSLLQVIDPAVQVLGVSSRNAEGAAMSASDIVMDGAGLHFVLTAGAETAQVDSPLLGRFNVDNLLAVGGVLLAQGHDLSLVARLLGQLQPIAGRMNRLGGQGSQPTVVVDYAHTPDALLQALTSLEDHVDGLLACVFGCGGDRDTGKRPQMAAIAEAHADRVIVTDDNPRTEDGDAIVADILAGFRDAASVTVQRDRAEAIDSAIATAHAGDVVLIAGKGHEPYQDVQGIKHPFDDSQVAQQCLDLHFPPMQHAEGAPR